MLRSLGKSRETQKSSPIGKEKVNKDWYREEHPRSWGGWELRWLGGANRSNSRSNDSRRFRANHLKPAIRTVLSWKRLKGDNPEGKNFRKLPRRKQSSAKISKISRNALKSSKKWYLLSSEKSSEISSANIFIFHEVFRCFYPLHFYPLALSSLD